MSNKTEVLMSYYAKVGDIHQLTEHMSRDCTFAFPPVKDDAVSIDGEDCYGYVQRTIHNAIDGTSQVRIEAREWFDTEGERAERLADLRRAEWERRIG